MVEMVGKIPKTLPRLQDGGQVSGSKAGGTSLGGVGEAEKFRIEGGGAHFPRTWLFLTDAIEGSQEAVLKNRGSGGPPVSASSG